MNIIEVYDCYEGLTFGGTSKGMAPKWRLEDGSWAKQSLLGYESKAEKLISDTLGMSTMDDKDFVKFELVDLKIMSSSGIIQEGCLSESFLEPGEVEVTFTRILSAMGIDTGAWLRDNGTIQSRFTSMVAIIKEGTGLDVSDYLRRVIAIDYLFLNEDRHLNNLAIKYTADGRYVECPVFDNGLSLLSDEEYFPKTREGYGPTIRSMLRKVKAKPLFSTNHKKQFKVICGGVSPFTIDEQEMRDYLRENRQWLGRMYPIMLQRIQACPEFFTNEKDVLDFNQEDRSQTNRHEHNHQAQVRVIHKDDTDKGNWTGRDNSRYPSKPINHKPKHNKDNKMKRNINKHT